MDQVNAQQTNQLPVPAPGSALWRAAMTFVDLSISQLEKKVTFFLFKFSQFDIA